MLHALYIVECSSFQGSFHFREYKKVTWCKTNWKKVTTEGKEFGKINTQASPQLLFHSCSYGISVGFCPYRPWGTYMHKCQVLHSHQEVWISIVPVLAYHCMNFSVAVITEMQLWHCCWLASVQSVGGLHSQCCGVTLPVSWRCRYFHQNTLVSGWHRPGQCEFQCVLCTARHLITTACCCTLCPENS